MAGSPRAFSGSYIVAFAFVAATGLGATFFVMVQFLTGSAWSVTVRRIMENIMITLPVCALLFSPVAFGLKEIFSWTDSAMVAGDAALNRSRAVISHRPRFPDSHLRLFRPVVDLDFLHRPPIHQAGQSEIDPADAHHVAMEPPLRRKRFLVIVVCRRSHRMTG